jgi:hypothetical protein
MTAHPDESYCGKMFECKCGFMAYNDAWDEQGHYTETREPF